MQYNTIHMMDVEHMSQKSSNVVDQRLPLKGKNKIEEEEEEEERGTDTFLYKCEVRARRGSSVNMNDRFLYYQQTFDSVESYLVKNMAAVKGDRVDQGYLSPKNVVSPAEAVGGGNINLVSRRPISKSSETTTLSSIPMNGMNKDIAIHIQDPQSKAFQLSSPASPGASTKLQVPEPDIHTQIQYQYLDANNTTIAEVLNYRQKMIIENLPEKTNTANNSSNRPAAIMTSPRLPKGIRLMSSDIFEENIELLKNALEGMKKALKDGDPSIDFSDFNISKSDARHQSQTQRNDLSEGSASTSLEEKGTEAKQTNKALSSTFQTNFFPNSDPSINNGEGSGAPVMYSALKRQLKLRISAHRNNLDEFLKRMEIYRKWQLRCVLSKSRPRGKLPPLFKETFTANDTRKTDNKKENNNQEGGLRRRKSSYMEPTQARRNSLLSNNINDTREIDKIRNEAVSSDRKERIQEITKPSVIDNEEKFRQQLEEAKLAYNWVGHIKGNRIAAKFWTTYTQQYIKKKVSKMERQKLQLARSSYQILQEEQQLELEEKLKFKNERRAIREYEDSLKPQKHAWMQLIKLIVISKQFLSVISEEQERRILWHKEYKARLMILRLCLRYVYGREIRRLRTIFEPHKWVIILRIKIWRQKKRRKHCKMIENFLSDLNKIKNKHGTLACVAKRFVYAVRRYQEKIICTQSCIRRFNMRIRFLKKNVIKKWEEIIVSRIDTKVSNLGLTNQQRKDLKLKHNGIPVEVRDGLLRGFLKECMSIEGFKRSIYIRKVRQFRDILRMRVIRMKLKFKHFNLSADETWTQYHDAPPLPIKLDVTNSDIINTLVDIAENYMEQLAILWNPKNYYDTKFLTSFPRPQYIGKGFALHLYKKNYERIKEETEEKERKISQEREKKIKEQEEYNRINGLDVCTSSFLSVNNDEIGVEGGNKEGQDTINQGQSKDLLQLNTDEERLEFFRGKKFILLGVEDEEEIKEFIGSFEGSIVKLVGKETDMIIISNNENYKNPKLDKAKELDIPTVVSKIFRECFMRKLHSEQETSDANNENENKNDEDTYTPTSTLVEEYVDDEYGKMSKNTILNAILANLKDIEVKEENSVLSFLSL